MFKLKHTNFTLINTCHIGKKINYRSTNMISRKVTFLAVKQKGYCYIQETWSAQVKVNIQNSN